MVRILSCFLSIVFLMVHCCDDGTESIDCSVLNNPGVELVTPQGTEVFSIGESVEVRWKVDPEKIALVDIKVSTSSQDGPFYSIFGGSIPVPLEGGIQCMDTVWVIGEEPGHTFSYSPPQTVYLRVEKYSAANEYSDVSGMITINE